jgi:hypothetical protein
VGGCSGFLEQMKKDGVKPDIKTFTQLLDTIPSTKAAELVTVHKYLSVTLRTRSLILLLSEHDTVGRHSLGLPTFMESRVRV